LYAAGANAFALDFSLGSPEDLIRACEIIRMASKKRHPFPTIVANLQRFGGVDIVKKLNSPEPATRKSRIDWKFITNLGIDWIVLPPATSIDIDAEIRARIGGETRIVATLDRASMSDAFEPIVEASDAVLIVQNDVGADSLSIDAQRNIIEVCSRLRRPAIIEIPISESAISTRPNSSAGSLKINAAMHIGEDAVMLSMESLPDEKHRYEVVELVGKAMEENECNFSRGKCAKDEAAVPHKSVIDAVCAAAKEAAEFSCADVVVLFTSSLETIVRCSKMCFQVPIILVTESHALASKSALCRGVHPVIAKKEFNIEQIRKTAKVIASDRGFTTAGDLIVVLDDISGNSVMICRL
jgi:pyruvate kinase